MNRFSLDYGNTARPPLGQQRQKVRLPWRVGRRPAGGGYVLAGALLLVSLLVSGGVRLRQLHTENQQLRSLHDAQRLRYDSLLSAKLEADRRLHRLMRPAPAGSNGFLTTP